MIADVLTHAAIGGGFALTGACVRGTCQHWHHRIFVGGLLILLESAVMVQVVG